jgi:hypothetical protein
MSKAKTVLIFQEAAGAAGEECGESFDGGKSDFGALDGKIVCSAEIKLAMIFMIARGLRGFGLKRREESLRGNLLRLAPDGFLCLN